MTSNTPNLFHMEDVMEDNVRMMALHVIWLDEDGQ